MPVEHDERYRVYIPDTDVYVGSIRTEVLDNGLTVINRTLPGHMFYDGMVERRATQTIDGAWQVTTRGIGNNVEPGMNGINQVFGPGIFDGLDRQMRANIERHHGRKSFVDSTRASRSAVVAGCCLGDRHVVLGAKTHG